MNLLFGLGISAFSLAFQPVSRPAGIYLNASEFRTSHPGQPGTDAVSNLFSTKVVLINQPNSAEKCVSKFPLDNVWGYVEHNGTAWRVFKSATYRIEAADTFMVYSRLTSNGRFTSRHYYFSTGPAAALLPMSRYDLRQTFADNPQFLALLSNLRWYQSPLDRDQSTQQYRAVQLFHQSLAQ